MVCQCYRMGLVRQVSCTYYTYSVEPRSLVGKRVERTRNAGKLTEAGYWGAVRSSLRRGFRYWAPAMNAKLAARRPYTGENKRQKWEYKCAHCKKWYMDKDVQIDHKIPTGSLRSSKDLAGFLERLTPEKGFQILCLSCHQSKTNKERGK